MSEDRFMPTVGFIGTGTITTALVTGFCNRAADEPFPIVVSPQMEENAAKLRAQFPERVSVARHLQEVVDRSDFVVLAVLPQVGEEVCRSLKFRPNHKVINFLSDKTLPEIRSWIGETDVLVHMVPMTFNEFCDGPIVLCPPNREVAEIFGRIGRIIEVEERCHAAVFAAVSGCVTPFFSIMDALIDWIASEGVPAELAAGYVTSFFYATCNQGVGLDREGVHTWATVSTPGGINLQARDLIEEKGGYAAWADAMRSVLARLTANIPKSAPASGADSRR